MRAVACFVEAYFAETFVALIAETVAAAIVHVSIFRVAAERALQTRIVRRGAFVLLVVL